MFLTEFTNHYICEISFQTFFALYIFSPESILIAPLS